MTTPFTTNRHRNQNEKHELAGVLPAITTPFNADLTVDHGFLAIHCRWLVDSGCKGVVALGSLGEGATFGSTEKNQVLETCVEAIGDRAFVVAGVSSLSTTEAVSISKGAEERDCNGLMVLAFMFIWVIGVRPRPTGALSFLTRHCRVCFTTIPSAYTTDFLPEHVDELLREFPNLSRD